jgi:hypothetical protein
MLVERLFVSLCVYFASVCKCVCLLGSDCKFCVFIERLFVSLCCKCVCVLY